MILLPLDSDALIWNLVDISIAMYLLIPVTNLIYMQLCSNFVHIFIMLQMSQFKVLATDTDFVTHTVANTNIFG